MNPRDRDQGLPRRLRRLPELRIDGRTPIFFITLCTHDRRPVLAEEAIHRLFRSFCRSSPRLARIWVGRYVLMPDHIHAFVAGKNLHGLSRWVGSLKKYIAAYWRRAGEKGPF